MRPSVRRTAASSQTTSGMWTRTTTCSSPSTTPMTMLTSTIAWCTPCVECARRAHWSTLVMTPHTSFGSSSEQSHCHLHVIHGAFSLTRSLPSSFTFPSCLSPSTSSTTSCSLSSTTRSSWQVCATPPQKRVRAPWTPPTPSHLPRQKKAEIMVKHSRSSGTSWTKFVRTPTRRVVAKTVRRSSIGTWMGKSTELGMSFFHRKQRLFFSVYVNDIKMAGTKQKHGSHVEEIDEKSGSWRTHIISWSRKQFWDVLNVNANRMKLLLRNIQRCLNHALLLEQLKSYQGGKNLTQRRLRGLTTWKGMLENAWRDTASWQTKKSSSSTKFQVPAWMITNSKWKNLNQLENYHKYAHKLFFLMHTWHELGDQTFYGLSIKLQEQSQNGLRHATDVWQDWFQTFTTQITNYRQYRHVEQHDSALSNGFIPRLRLCWRLWGLKINLGVKSHVSLEAEHLLVSISWMYKK